MAGRLTGWVTGALSLFLTAVPAWAQGDRAAAINEEAAARYFAQIADDPPFLRAFLQAMPKGGDLHNHLPGAIYAETYLEWAAEDGLCVDISVPAILFAYVTTTCNTQTVVPAAKVLGDDKLRRELINALSIRSFEPTPGYDVQDQFFDTFNRMAWQPERLGDMLAVVTDRMARQNGLYLELMNTTELEKLIPMLGQTAWAGDVAAAYDQLMAGPFGAALDDLVASTKAIYDAADVRRRELGHCGTADARPGCDVEVRFLYQVIRTMPKNVVFAQTILGFALTQRDDRFVGLNFVAPEHFEVALKDYHTHMRMIDEAYKRMGAIPVTLHAGELTMGLVRPDQLKFHIRDAIETGHARRIGHGVDIAYEENAPELLAMMAEQQIMVEINLSSNESILNVAGDDHPIMLYRGAGVPVALSTDDEGVSRIDLTHEYQRAVETYQFTYPEMKEMSRNSLSYSFLPGASLWHGRQVDEACRGQMLGGDATGDCAEYLRLSQKARVQWELERRYAAFELNVARWPRPEATEGPRGLPQSPQLPQ